MNILFLSIGKFDDLRLKALYPDLVRALAKDNKVYVVTCVEERTGLETSLREECRCQVLRVKIGNIAYTNVIRKGINLILLEYQFLSAIKKYYPDVTVDLVVYSTPPIHFARIVAWIKKKHGARSYLLLKDIFPQNAVDLGMLSKTSPLCALYRMKEKQLYMLSDYIGGMSQANVDYVLKHNSFLKKENIEVCPNSVEVLEQKDSQGPDMEILSRYGIAADRIRMIYGGNLGKPQGIDFLIEVIRAKQNDKRFFFVIIGSGTEYKKLRCFIDEEKPTNVVLIKELPRDEYQAIAEVADIGLIFLDKRFTIPNIPSRILSYMQAAKPVMAVTDRVTDLKEIIADGNFGWWAESGRVQDVEETMERIYAQKDQFFELGQNGHRYLQQHFTADISAGIILKHFEDLK